MSLLLAAWVSLAMAAAPGPTGVVQGTVSFEQQGLFGEGAAKDPLAVVYLEQVDQPPVPPREHPRMAQKNKAFEPRLLVVTAGTEVDFPNEDLVFHNVFSLSQGNEFDLGVYRSGSSKAVRFSKPGVVDVFCNIHPDMIGSILVLQNERYARVGGDGHFRIEAPYGKYTLVAYWTRGVISRQQVEIGPAPASVDFKLVDSGKSSRHLNKYGQQYGRYK